MRNELCYFRGRWVPRCHLYDYGEEPIYIGPRRSHCSRKWQPSACLICLFLGGVLLNVWIR
jgi:hypothetical protein